jgi:hypothetical protein
VVAPKKLALGELAFALITEAAGVSLLFVCAFGYRMRVGLLDDLNFVFCLAKKAISLGQLVPSAAAMNRWCSSSISAGNVLGPRTCGT